MGILASFLLWLVSVTAGFFGAGYLAKGKLFAPKWRLFAAFLLASALYFVLRYRAAGFIQHDPFALRTFFGPGSFPAAERIACIVCVVLFYALTVLAPNVVEHPWASFLLLLLLPFALKLLLGLTGLIAWDGLPSLERPL